MDIKNKKIASRNKIHILLAKAELYKSLKRVESEKLDESLYALLLHLSQSPHQINIIVSLIFSVHLLQSPLIEYSVDCILV
jgi:hypothetical protein